MKISVLGPPGAGKGTQATLLAKTLGIPRICAGEMLRELGKERSSLGKKVKETIEGGELVPDDLVSTLLEGRLKEGDAKKGFVLDGIPRTENQVQMFDKLFSLDKVILLKLDKETAISRLLGRGREDDTPKAIERRFAIFNREIGRIAERYRAAGVLVEIDAKGDPQEVHRRIISHLTNEQTNKDQIGRAD